MTISRDFNHGVRKLGSLLTLVTVNLECLWYKLLTIGISGKMFHAVKSLYNNVKCAIKVNDVIIPFLDVTLGVKQGCRLSPTLFAICINDLAEESEALNCGIEIGSEQLALLLYTDAIVLLAPSEQSLQVMLNTLHEWCIKWRLLINQEKTKINFRPVATQKTHFDFKCGKASTY